MLPMQSEPDTGSYLGCGEHTTLTKQPPGTAGSQLFVLTDAADLLFSDAFPAQ
jgi:hypothetical protein